MQKKHRYLAGILLALMASQTGYAQNKISGGVAACPQRRVTATAAFDAIAAKYSAKFVGMCLGAIGPGNVITPAYSVTKCYGEKRAWLSPQADESDTLRDRLDNQNDDRHSLGFAGESGLGES